MKSGFCVECKEVTVLFNLCSKHSRLRSLAQVSLKLRPINENKRCRYGYTCSCVQRYITLNKMMIEFLSKNFISEASERTRCIDRKLKFRGDNC